MKKKIVFMTSMLLAAVATQAQGTDKVDYAVSELSVSSFHKLVVNANTDVVLVQNDTLKKAYIEGDEKLVSGIAITVVNGTMTISSPKNIAYRGKVQVTVAVKDLSDLQINADAGVVTFDPLHSPRLNVNVNGLCDLHLKSTGKIFLDAGDDYSIRYLKQPGEITSVRSKEKI